MEKVMRFIFAFISLSLFPSPLFCQVKPVFHLSFEDNVIDNVEKAEGSIFGGEFVEGKIGKGIHLDGEQGKPQYIRFNLAKDRFIQDFEEGPFTISIWIKPDSTGSQDPKALNYYKNQQEILTTASSGIGPGWTLMFTWRMIVFRSGTGKRDETGKGDFWEISTNPAIDKVDLDQWNHVVVMRDEKGILKLYLNGKKAAESNKKFDIVPSNIRLLVGYRYKGIIDEVEIFKGTIDPENILKEYQMDKEEVKRNFNLDGKIEEEIWKKGKVFTGFYHIGTDKFASVQTKVICNYDQDNLYFAFICDEPEIEKLKNNVRENSLKVFGDDSVELMIDTDNDKANYYHFLFNPSGYYGARIMSQGGLVGVEIKGFELYTGCRIDRDKWLGEVVIPIYSLENIKEEIALNFARNRRVSSTNEESSIANKGSFHAPTDFKVVKLEGIDLSLYGVELKNPEVLETVKEGEKILAKIKTGIKNLTDRDKEYLLSVYNKKLGILSRLKVPVAGKDEKKLILKCEFKSSDTYETVFNIKCNNKTIYNSIIPLKITYDPILVELVRPIYRDSIYSTQKIDEIKLKINIGLKEDETKGVVGEVLIVDNKKCIIQSGLFKPVKEQIVALKIPELKAGAYKILVRLVKDGKEIIKNEKLLHKLPPPEKGNEVYIDENLNLVINGKPIMPIVWWGGSPFEEIAKTKADGIIVGFGSGAFAHLDELGKLGMLGVCFPFGGNEKKSFFSGDTLSKEVIKTITDRINSVKQHPALLYYYLVDEPAGHGFTPQMIREVYELIKEIDPYHPISIANNSVKEIEMYIDCADMFQPDPYVDPLVDGKLTRPMTYIVLFMEKIKESGKNTKFIGLTPQVFDAGKVFLLMPPYTTRDNRAPTFMEERCINYLGIVHGAKGFHYYVYGKKDANHWGAVNYPDLKIGMPYLIAEKKSLSDVILLGKENNQKVKINNDNIHFLVKEFNGKTYIFVVNVAPQPQNVEVALTDIKELKVISEGRKIKTENGKFIDKFIPYDVHLYTEDLKYKDVIDLKKVEEEIKEKGGWYAYEYKN